MVAQQTENSGRIIVTIFYTGAESGAQLVSSIHRVARKVWDREDLDPRPWRLDILGWPEMQAQAANDIACSDIVVIPADHAHADAAFFRRWAETWPAALGDCRLLLVPHHGVADTRPRVQQFVRWLQELASSKGMDFIQAGPGDGALSDLPSLGREKPVPSIGESLPNPFQLRAGDVSLSDSQPPRVSRFLGLNE
jgi:hypothetical protein